MNMLFCQIQYMKKKLKSHTKTTNLEYQLQHGTKNLNYLVGHILYQIILSIS